MEQNEKKILTKKLRKVKDKELKGNIHKLINRLVFVLFFVPRVPTNKTFCLRMTFFMFETPFTIWLT